MSIGDNIKAIRNERKLTQENLAKEMNISRSYLSDIENNRKNPSTKTLQSISEKLGVTMYYLTTGEKALSDLTNDEATELFQDTFKNMKEEIQEVVSSELTTYELNYLSTMVRFLKMADKDDIKKFTAVPISLTRFLEYKNSKNTDEKLMEYVAVSELNNIIKFLQDFFTEYYKAGD